MDLEEVHLTPGQTAPLWVVTGAAGFLGNNLIRILLDRGYRVRACVTSIDDAVSLRGLSCETVILDVRNEEQVLQAFSHDIGEQVWVAHCAGIVSITSRVTRTVHDVNVGGTKNVLSACRKLGVQRLVYVSSVHTIREPDPPAVICELEEADDFNPDHVMGEYAKTKTEATREVLRAEDLWRVVVQPSGIIGPGDYGDSHLTRLVRDTASGQLTATVPGGYDLVDVRDVALGIILAGERGVSGRSYILSGSYVLAADLTKSVAALSGRKRRFTMLPMWFAKLVAPIAELYYRVRGTGYP